MNSEDINLSLLIIYFSVGLWAVVSYVFVGHFINIKFLTFCHSFVFLSIKYLCVFLLSFVFVGQFMRVSVTVTCSQVSSFLARY